MSEQTDVYVLPASFGQQRFYALDKENPGNPTWSVPVRFRLTGPLNPTLLRRCLVEIVRRHEILRTTFQFSGGKLMQVIAPSLQVETPMTDLRSLSPAERESSMDRLSFEEARFRFDLASGPLFRTRLLRTGDLEHILLVNAHHSVTDYASVGILASELAALYQDYFLNLKSTLVEPAVQYGDYAVWENEQAGGHAVQSTLAWWKEQLRDLPLADFPVDRPRGAEPTYDGAILSRLLPVALTGRIQELASRQGATFFQAMLAGLCLTIHRYTGQAAFGIGTQVSGRTSVELESLLGLFVNTIVLRANLSGNPPFPELLDRIRQVVVESIGNGSARFDQILRELRPSDYPRHDSLFRLNFICQRDPVKPQEFGGVKLTVIPSKCQGALYDLNVFLVLRNEGWRLACEYNTALFEAETITLLLENYQATLESIVSDANRRIGEFAPLASRNTPRLAATDEKHIPAIGTLPVIPTAGEEAYAFPLTPAQRRFWRLEQLMPGSPTLNMPAAMRLKGAVDADLLERALNDVVRRHDSLRSSFRATEDGAVQIVHPRVAAILDRSDFRKLPPLEREARAMAMLRKDACAPFDMSKAPLVRAGLIRLDEEDHILAVTVPHIICDGWSAGIVIRELAALYEAYKQCRPSPLAELAIQYVDFAHWQNEWLKSSDFEDDLRFWTKRLDGKLPLLDLPTDRPSARAMLSRGDTETRTLSEDLVSGLKEFTKRERITLFMLFLAVFKAMLYRYTGQEDILVGSPVSGRAPESEGIVGLFSYPICLRTDVSGNPTFGELLRRTETATLDALAHKDIPFEHVIGELRPEQMRGRNPLFQIYFLHQVGFLQPIEVPGASWIPITWLSPVTSFDLHLATLERQGKVVVRLEYNAEIFEAETIRTMLCHFESIVRAGTVNPGLRLSELPMVSSREERNRVDASDEEGCANRVVAFREIDRRTQNFAAFLRESETRLAVTVARRGDAPPRDEMEVRLVGIWEELLGVSPIGIRDNFFELGGRSLPAVLLFARIEKIWGKKLALSTLFQAPTIEKLTELLRQGQVTEGWRSLVTIQSGGSRLPLYIVSGVGGNVVRFYGLARHLPPDQPVYALQPPGLDGKQRCLTTVEEMASHYIREIKARNLEGPYCLAGYSFGGLVVFEMARQFAAAGDRVALTVLLDTPEMSYLQRRSAAISARQTLIRWMNGILRLFQDSAQSRRVFERARRALSHAIFRIFHRIGQPLPQRLGSIQDINSFAASQYVPHVYPGKLTLFRTGRPSNGNPDDHQLGWQRYAAEGVEVHEIPGEHLEITAEPHVTVLAEKLQLCLERVQGADSLFSPEHPKVETELRGAKRCAAALAAEGVSA